MKKPICENCGQSVHPAGSAPFIRGIEFLEIPKHCPNCGTKLSASKQKQVDNYTDYLCVLKCVFAIGFIIVIIVLIFYRVL